MNLNDMTYGVEIEATVPHTANLPAGGYGYANGVELEGYGFPAGWRATYDCSIACTVAGHRGVEFISGVLRGEAGIASIVATLAKLRELGAKVNPSCGFHVHIGLPVAAMAKLESVVYLMGNLEKAFYAASGTKRRERSRWCRSIKANVNEGSYDQWNLKNRPDEWRFGGMGHEARYRSLNLYNLYSGSKPTVEFRVFGSTLNTTKAVTYVRMALALVHKGTNCGRRVDWHAKQISRKNPGGAMTGSEEVGRFLYRMGWNRGGTDGQYGLLGMEVAGAPTLQQMKRELRRLADKYDAEA